MGFRRQLQKTLLSRSTCFPMERTLFIEAVPFKQVFMKIVLGYFSVPGAKLGTRAPPTPSHHHRSKPQKPRCRKETPDFLWLQELKGARIDGLMFDVIKYAEKRCDGGEGAYVQVENWPHLQSSSQVISHASMYRGQTCLLCLENTLYLENF